MIWHIEIGGVKLGFYITSLLNLISYSNIRFSQTLLMHRYN